MQEEPSICRYDYPLAGMVLGYQLNTVSGANFRSVQEAMLLAYGRRPGKLSPQSDLSILMFRGLKGPAMMVLVNPVQGDEILDP